MRIKIISISIVIVLALGIGGYVVVAQRGEPKDDRTQKAGEQDKDSFSRLPLSVVSESPLSLLSEARLSWSGELVSPTTVEVHASSEGTLVDLNVSVGTNVSRGDVIGQLSVPPASVERADASAKKIEMLIRARANAQATSTLVSQTKKQLLEAKKSLVPARDIALSLSEKDSEKEQYMNASSKIELEKVQNEWDAKIAFARKERDQAALQSELKDKELKTIVRQTIDKSMIATSYNRPDMQTLARLPSVQFKRSIGSLNTKTRVDFIAALHGVVRDLSSNQSLDESAVAYAQSFKQLMFSSTEDDDMTVKELSDMQNMARMDQMNIVETINEKKEYDGMVRVKEEELNKMIAERDKETTMSEINAKRAQINSQSTEFTRRKAGVDAQLEYLTRVREIDEKIAELDRDSELAYADVKAAEASYNTFVNELSSQTIRAQRSGTVSGIFKQVGDYIMPDMIVATISAEESKDEESFVRFRIPNDQKPPSIGDDVFIARPGFPFERMKGIVTGVGATVGANGFFVAEAEFEERPDWPVRTLVRVMPADASPSLVIPFSAVRWDNANAARVFIADTKEKKLYSRVIKTGKAIGDEIEVIGGLSGGDTYLSREVSDEMIQPYIAEGDFRAIEKKDGAKDDEIMDLSEEDKHDVMGHE